MNASAVRTANSVVRFLLELTALTVLALWGWHALGGQPQRLLLALAAPLVAATAVRHVRGPAARHISSACRDGSWSRSSCSVPPCSRSSVSDIRHPAAVLALVAGLNTALVHAGDRTSGHEAARGPGTT